MMYIVLIKWVNNDPETFCVVTDTREKAQKYIDNELAGYKYNGLGYYTITQIPRYEGSETNE